MRCILRNLWCQPPLSANPLRFFDGCACCRSGKSTFLRALDVLYNNAEPTLVHKIGLQQQVLESINVQLSSWRDEAPSEELKQRADALCQQMTHWLSLLANNQVVQAPQPFVQELYELWSQQPSFRARFWVEDAAITFLHEPHRMEVLFDGSDTLSTRDFLLWRDTSKTAEVGCFSLIVGVSAAR